MVAVVFAVQWPSLTYVVAAWHRAWHVGPVRRQQVLLADQQADIRCPSTHHPPPTCNLPRRRRHLTARHLAHMPPRACRSAKSGAAAQSSDPRRERGQQAREAADRRYAGAGHQRSGPERALHIGQASGGTCSFGALPAEGAAAALPGRGLGPAPGPQRQRQEAAAGGSSECGGAAASAGAAQEAAGRRRQGGQGECRRRCLLELPTRRCCCNVHVRAPCCRLYSDVLPEQQRQCSSSLAVLPCLALSQVPPERVRNFSIIAHIDHGGLACGCWSALAHSWVCTCACHAQPGLVVARACLRACLRACQPVSLCCNLRLQASPRWRTSC